MYSLLINLLECQSAQVFCINLVQFTWSYAFCQSMKQAYNSSVMFKVHSNIILSRSHMMATKYIWRTEHNQCEIWGLLLHHSCSVSITGSIVIIVCCIFPPCHLPSHKPWTHDIYFNHSAMANIIEVCIQKWRKLQWKSCNRQMKRYSSDTKLWQMTNWNMDTLTHNIVHGP